METKYSHYTCLEVTNLFPCLREYIVWKLLLTILFSDFVSFGFSTTEIVI